MAAACGGDSVAPEPDPTVTGRWSGPLDSSTTLVLVLAQDPGSAVGGSGSIAGPGGSAALTVESGTHVFPNLSLVLGSPGFDPMNLAGTVTETYIDATLNGSGFNNDPVTLVRR